MKPKLLYNGRRPLYVLSEDGKAASDLENELDAFRSNPQTVRKVASLEAIMERFASGQQLTSQMFHEAGSIDGVKVFEFIKQPIRVYCVAIPDSGGSVLLTHSVWKKWQKTKSGDLQKALAALQSLPALKDNPS